MVLIKQRIAVLFCLLTICGIYAQEEAADGIFSPFVSQLTAEIRNNLVRLSWVDSRNIQGPVYIYRSVQPIDNSALADLKPIVIPWGIQNYVDETEGDALYYYYAAASDINGQRYDIIIPYTNTVAAGLSASPWMNAAEYSARQGSSYQPEDVSGLNAFADGERVIITFSAGEYFKNPVLYRHTQPIRRVQDLLSASIIQSGGSSPVIDYPAPGFSYYYAIFIDDDISKGTINIQPGKNATINPIEIAGRTVQTQPEIRAMPLPAMSIQKTNAETNYSQLLNPASVRTPMAEENIQMPSAVVPPEKRPRVFARDLETPAGGEESILRIIVQGPITQREWLNARDQLVQYLSLPRSPITEARARFYLGQAYYFTAMYREALVEFLFVKDRYPNEAAEWLEAVLTVLGG